MRAHGVDVAEVDLRIDALREQVDAEGDEVDVAGALPVAEQAALDAVGTGLVAELGGGDRGAAIVVRVQAQQHVLAVVEVPRHPFDGVRVDVRGGHLDGGRQIDDDLALRGRHEDVHDPVADLDRELELGARVALRRVLVVDDRARHSLLVLLAPLRALHGDVDDALLVGAEHHVALQDARRVVEVHDRLLGTLDRLEGARDELLARLGEHLDGHVIRDHVLFDELTHEVEVGLARRGEADLDLLVAHPHEQVEHDALALGAHRIDEGLVAVAQVDRAPHRRAG